MHDESIQFIGDDVSSFVALKFWQSFAEEISAFETFQSRSAESGDLDFMDSFRMTRIGDSWALESASKAHTPDNGNELKYGTIVSIWT